MVQANQLLDDIRRVMLDIKSVPPPPVIIKSAALFDTVEDWSRVRSPSRAKRRRAHGKRQNVAYIRVPKPDAYRMQVRDPITGRMYDEIHMHPITAAKFRDLRATREDVLLQTIERIENG